MRIRSAFILALGVLAVAAAGVLLSVVVVGFSPSSAEPPTVTRSRRRPATHPDATHTDATARRSPHEEVDRRAVRGATVSAEEAAGGASEPGWSAGGAGAGAGSGVGADGAEL